jgi:hypothetical protein
VTFTFTGISFGLLYTAGPRFGNVDIYLDGVKIDTLNEKAAKIRYQQIWNYKERFHFGQHELRLVYANAESAQITLDGVFIIQPLP